MLPESLIGGATYFGQTGNWLGMMNLNWNLLAMYRTKKLSYSEVLKRTKGFRLDNPKIYSDLVEQFKDMSTGGDGGIYFQSYSRSSVRDHYYDEWSNEDFVRLLKDLGEY